MGDAMKEATLKDVAREAGVSFSTVSRVVRGNYPVSEEVRKKVESVMAACNYRPNAIARSLRSQRSNLVALVVADISNRFFMDAAKGLEERIGAIGYHMVIASTQGEAKKERVLLDALVEQRIDGLVIASSDPNGDKINDCMRKGIPVVLLDRVIKGVNASSVVWNNVELACELTTMLVHNGHRDIGIVNVSLRNSTGLDRLAGFKKAVAGAGLSLRKDLVSPPNFSPDDAYLFVKETMRLPNPPSALFCANNLMAEGTVRALSDLGLRINDDVSLVCCGDPECNKYIDPKITGADLNSVEMGRRVETVLREHLFNKDAAVTQMVLKADIVCRNSIKQL